MLQDNSGKSLRELLEDQGFGQSDIKALARALNVADCGPAFEAALSELAIVALHEMCEWILARKRFSTIAEMDANRIMRIFLDIRRDMPDVEKVADQFAIPEARATSMLTRMRYGAARRLRAARYQACSGEIENLLQAVEEDEDGRKCINVDKETLEAFNEAWWHILKATDEHGKGGAYEAAEKPDFIWSGKYGGRVIATVRMWNHIVKWLKQKHRELENV